jgi:Trm5-related predicted tRNA methylase
MKPTASTLQQIKDIRISAEILKLMLEGKDLETAFNTVLGTNAYTNMASELYDELNKKQSK